MKEIICNLSMFSYSHPIYIADESGKILLGHADESDVVDKIFQYAAANQVFNIHLFGVENFIQPFVDDLSEKFMTAYSNNNFKILIN